MKMKDTKKIAKRKQSAVKSFLRDENGNLIMFSLFMFIIMVFTSGMAVDIARHEAKRVALQNISDAATLSAAKISNKENEYAVIDSFFSTAGFPGLIKPDDVQLIDKQTDPITGDIISRKVKLNTGLVVPTAFMTWLDVDQMTAPAHSVAYEELIDLEVSLVVDVSGSMGYPSNSPGLTKIQALKQAVSGVRGSTDPNAEEASDENGQQLGFIDIIMNNPNIGSSGKKPTMSIVPFNSSVNAGAALLSNFNVADTPEVLDDGTSAARTTHPFAHCVRFADADFGSVPILPSQPLLQQSHINRAGYNWECRYGGNGQIIPVSSDRIKLKTAINALTAGGNTAADHGAKWGVALLDPAFRPVVENLRDNFTVGSETIDNNPGSPQISYKSTDSVVFPAASNTTPQAIEANVVNRPSNYGRDGVLKVLVLMSDGKNTLQHDLKTAADMGYTSNFFPNGIKGQKSPVFYNAATDEYSVKVSGDFNLTAFTNFLNDPANSGVVSTIVPDINTMTTAQFEAAVQAWLNSDNTDPYNVRPQFYQADSQRYRRHIDQDNGTFTSITQLTFADLYAQYTPRQVRSRFFRSPRENGFLSYNDYSVTLRYPYILTEGENSANVRLRNICNAAKANNIRIYSIAFEVPDSSARQLLKDCASGDLRYYDVQSGNQLRKVFTEIANSLIQLRLTQ